MWQNVINKMGGMAQQRKPNWQNWRPPDKDFKQIRGKHLDVAQQYPSATPQVAQHWLNAYYSHPDTVAGNMQSLSQPMIDWVQNYYRKR